MLNIRQGQYESLGLEARSSYRKELLVHFQEFAPELYRTAGEEQFYQFIDYGLDKAGRIGLNLRGPVRLLLDVMCMVGQDFDQDPQYRRMWPEGNPAEIPMPFAQRLRAGFLEYLTLCIGAEGKGVLTQVLHQILKWEPDPATSFREWTHENFSRIYPEKIAYMGEKNLSEFLDVCDERADEAKIAKNPGKQLVVILSSSFGGKFLTNPLYPWVAKRLLTEAPEEERVEKTISALRIYASKMVENLEKGR